MTPISQSQGPSTLSLDTDSKSSRMNGAWKALKGSARDFISWEGRELKADLRYFSLDSEDWEANLEALLQHTPSKSIDALINKEYSQWLPKNSFILEGYSDLNEQMKCKREFAWRKWNYLGLATGLTLVFVSALASNYHCLERNDHLREGAMRQCRFEWYGKMSDPARLAQAIISGLSWTLACSYAHCFGDFGLRGSLRRQRLQKAYAGAWENMCMSISKKFWLCVEQDRKVEALALYQKVESLKNTLPYHKAMLTKELGLSEGNLKEMFASFDQLADDLQKRDVKSLFEAKGKPRARL